MGDKTKEKECIDRLLKSNSVRGEFAKSIHKNLVKYKSCIDSNRERPDFVISMNAGVIGIEHCLVDVFFKLKKHKAQSMIREQESRGKRKIDEYSVDSDRREAEFESGKAMDFLLGMVEERCDFRKDFSYSDFVQNFRKVCDAHNSNCNVYRSNLRRYISDPEDTKLGCLIEIPYPKTSSYILRDFNAVERVQALNGLPITQDVLNIIQSMKGFDFVALCMYCFETTEKLSNTLVYYFQPDKISEAVR